MRDMHLVSRGYSAEVSSTSSSAATSPVPHLSPSSPLSQVPITPLGRSIREVRFADSRLLSVVARAGAKGESDRYRRGKNFTVARVRDAVIANNSQYWTTKQVEDFQALANSFDDDSVSGSGPAVAKGESDRYRRRKNFTVERVMGEVVANNSQHWTAKQREDFQALLEASVDDDSLDADAVSASEPAVAKGESDRHRRGNKIDRASLMRDVVANNSQYWSGDRASALSRMLSQSSPITGEFTEGKREGFSGSMSPTDVVFYSPLVVPFTRPESFRFHRTDLDSQDAAQLLRHVKSMVTPAYGSQPSRFLLESAPSSPDSFSPAVSSSSRVVSSSPMVSRSQRWNQAVIDRQLRGMEVAVVRNVKNLIDQQISSLKAYVRLFVSKMVEDKVTLGELSQKSLNLLIQHLSSSRLDAPLDTLATFSENSYRSENYGDGFYQELYNFYVDSLKFNEKLITDKDFIVHEEELNKLCASVSYSEGMCNFAALYLAHLQSSINSFSSFDRYIPKYMQDIIECLELICSEYQPQMDFYCDDTRRIAALEWLKSKNPEDDALATLMATYRELHGAPDSDADDDTSLLSSTRQEQESKEPTESDSKRAPTSPSSSASK